MTASDTPQKRALVTGAGGRLGRTMALALADQGFDICVHYSTSKAGADETCRLIQARGRNAVAVEANLMNDAETYALFSEACEQLGGPISALINNASIFEYDRLDTVTMESWERHFSTNLRAPFLLTQALAAQVPDPVEDDNGEMLAQGIIVNMVDQRVQKLTPEFMSYTLAKTGLWTLTQTSAQALAGRVRVNAIGPGPTVIGHRQSQQHFDTQRANTPTGRGSNPEDIAHALLYFLNAPAVTGQMLCVDGGQHLAWKTPDIVGRIDK